MKSWITLNCLSTFLHFLFNYWLTNIYRHIFLPCITQIQNNIRSSLKSIVITNDINGVNGVIHIIFVYLFYVHIEVLVSCEVYVIYYFKDKQLIWIWNLLRDEHCLNFLYFLSNSFDILFYFIYLFYMLFNLLNKRFILIFSKKSKIKN